MCVNVSEIECESVASTATAHKAVPQPFPLHLAWTPVRSDLQCGLDDDDAGPCLCHCLNLTADVASSLDTHAYPVTRNAGWHTTYAQRRPII